jgi:hypothetical protein
MRHLARFVAHATAIAALVYGAAAPAGDMDMDDVDDAPTAEQMALDLVLVRPLSLAGTVLGTAVFIVALPFNVITLNLSDPARRLILEPAQYTFTRELGDLE